MSEGIVQLALNQKDEEIAHIKSGFWVLMLKLERREKSGQISVAVKDAGKLFTPVFLQAFAAAFSLHLLGFFLFHVSPFTIGHVATIFPPIEVKVDATPDSEAGVLAALEREKSAPVLPGPGMSSPASRPMRPVLLKRWKAYPKVLDVSHFPFEKTDTFHDHLNLGTPTLKREKPLRIRISGELADIPYTIKGFNKKKYLLKPHQSGNGYWGKIAYRVKVENRTGKIFWHEAFELPEEKKISKVGDKILSSLRFETPFQGFTSEGDVELEFLIGERTG